MNFWWGPLPAAIPSAVGGVTSPGGLHHVEQGMGDTGEGARVPQTLHTIEDGICV